MLYSVMSFVGHEYDGLEKKTSEEGAEDGMVG